MNDSIKRKNPESVRAAGDVGLAIGARLVAARNETGNDQIQFAADIDLSQSALSLYERGLVPRGWLTLRRLVEEKGIDANWLLTGKNNGR